MAKHDTSKKGTQAGASDPEGASADTRKEQAAAGNTVGGTAAEEQETTADGVEVETATGASEDAGTAQFGEEIAALRDLAAKKEAEAKEHYDRLTYLAAEFDNFRRRTGKEKEKLFADAVVEVTGAFLPVLDNLERAVKAAETVENPEAVSVRDGVAMVARQLQETLGKLGVTEIAAQGAPFDPNLHNAVMHVEDDAFGANEVVDVFQKGYLYKDETVVRHAMVKVAN